MNAAENAVLRGDLRRREPMAAHCSWRVGGPAELFYVPAGIEDLAAFLAQLPRRMPVMLLGLGSNLLVRDGGIRGAVIATHGVLSGLARTGEATVRAEAGLACAKLARACTQWGLGPAAFFAGIPGTVGGALAMNAGAYGGETWNHVERVETIDRRGVVHGRAFGEYTIGYRSVAGPPQEWFVAAHMRFAPDEAARPQAIRALLARRKESQPIGQPSCGSVFRNPPGAQAWRLIDSAGLRGERAGGAEVSPMHANFIVNTGAATAADIEALIERIIERVEAKHGVRLVPEVRIVGERA
jgi:UDP-N-acetylmuramate dehydrogenase